MFQWLKNLLGFTDDQPIKSDFKKVVVTPTYHPLAATAKPKGFAGGTLRTYEEPAVRYASHPEAVVVACFFNPQNSPYRLIAFQKWYRSIKHLNHRIIECVIGDDKPKWQLPESPYISRVTTESLLFHKEALLNKVIAELPVKFQYVFWLDTDILFTNPNWMAQGVEALQTVNLIQPFSYCVHLKRNELKPSFNPDDFRTVADDPKKRRPEMWRSFCARRYHCSRYNLSPAQAQNDNYDIHGHVGFAWGARREIVDKVHLYDRALIGGADHIVAHAGALQVPCSCISRSFTLDHEDVEEWSQDFGAAVEGKMGYVEGDLYHIWHGDIKDREYLKRIREFATEIAFITRRDRNGLWIYEGNNPYMKRYYRHREAAYYDGGYGDGFDGFDFGFAQDMGYALVDLMSLFGQPTYEDNAPYYEPQPYNDPVTDPVQSDTKPYEPGYFDYKSPGEDAQTTFERGADVQSDAPTNMDTPPVQSFTPSYEPGHWDYTTPGADPTGDMGSTFS